MGLLANPGVGKDLCRFSHIPLDYVVKIWLPSSEPSSLLDLPWTQNGLWFDYTQARRRAQGATNRIRDRTTG